MTKKTGFTLIELLVVITILAILVGAALPFVQNYVQESRISKAKSDLDEIARAIIVYETRENTYNDTTVKQLSGRYLNSSPIDPWGVPYIVATMSGVVYSSGPDRIADNYDDIVVSYQPPLSIVSIKWVDANQTGAVDTQNRPDYLMLQFSRRIATESLALTNPATAHKYFDWSATEKLTPNVKLEDAFDWPSFKLDNSGTLITLPLANDVYDIFVPGSDTLWVIDGDGLRDLASTTMNPGGNRCMASQTVIIMSSK